MKPARPHYDAVVIGGGFFGCCLALHLRQQLNDVLVIERGRELLGRASYRNQARVHRGYHYPRSFVTGLRSAANFQRFVDDFAPAIRSDFTKLYAIAARNSRVTANQFWNLCQRIHAPIQPAPPHLKNLFTSDLVEEVFLVQEYAFDAQKLRDVLAERLRLAQVEVLLESEVERVARADGGKGLRVLTADGGSVNAPRVFNCTYARINQLLQASGLPLLPIKLEITEIALVEPPDRLKPLGLTVMDGPFFSMMPFPAENVHSFSHVRYTPHESHLAEAEWIDPYEPLASRSWTSNFTLMLYDAVRYVPALRECRYVRSLLEAKAVLRANEHDDGRPILYRPNFGLPGFTLILGGKIDNVYDMIQAVQQDLSDGGEDQPGPERLEGRRMSVLAMPQSCLVSVLVVVENDEAVLGDFLAAVHDVLKTHYRFFELIVLDNASTDGSAQVLRESLNRMSGLRWLRLTRPHDPDIAWTAALEHCIGDFVVLMDVYRDPPAMIPPMVALAGRTRAVVVGQYTREPRLPRGHRLLRGIFSRLASWLLPHRINLEASYFRVYHRAAVTALTRIKNRRRHLKFLSALVGFKQVAVPVEPRQERGGRPPRGLFKSMSRAADLIISNSIRPLRWATGLGILASLINLMYLGYILVVFLVRQRLAEGWLTQSVMNTVMFLCLFLVLAVLGEYVGRILEEAQDQPLYFLEAEMDSPVSGKQTEDVVNVA